MDRNSIEGFVGIELVWFLCSSILQCHGDWATSHSYTLLSLINPEIAVERLWISLQGNWMYESPRYTRRRNFCLVYYTAIQLLQLYLKLRYKGIETQSTQNLQSMLDYDQRLVRFVLYLADRFVLCCVQDNLFELQ
jgi:hypothetical protein